MFVILLNFLFSSMGYKKETKGDDIYLVPKENHTHTLIWCHGLGDTGNLVKVNL